MSGALSSVAGGASSPGRESSCLKMKQGYRLAFLGSLIGAATLACYWPVLHSQFVNFDDNVYILQNLHVRSGLNWANVAWSLGSGYAGNWHPLTWVSHMLDYQLYGLNAGGHHLTNLLFHIVNSLLLLLALSRMTGSIWRSAFIAGLFALHPIHVESVAWIAERKDVLSTFFFLLTLLAYNAYVTAAQVQRASGKGQRAKSEVKTPGHELPSNSQVWLWFSLALVFFAFGLMSKPMLVTLPFVLLLLDFWPLARFQLPPIRDSSTPTPQNSSTPISRLLIEKLPFFALSLASSIVTYLVQQHEGAVASIENAPIEHRIPNALVSYLTYLAKLIWPSGLAIYYPPRKVISPELFVAAFGILILLSFLSLRLLRKRPYLAVGWFWYLGTLVPVIGFIQVGLQAMADRYTYIPSIGFFIAITWGLSDLFSGIFRVPHPAARVAKLLVPTFLCTILLACAVATSGQAKVWQNSEVLYRHALAVTRNNAVAHYNLNTALIQNGRTDEAVALATTIDNPVIYLNLGSALLEQGRLDEAIQQFAAAVRVHPTYAEAISDWGFALVLQGKLDEAIAKYREALALKPDVPQTHYALGQALLLQHKRDDAIAEFNAALQVAPDFPASLNDLAWIRATDPDPQVRNGAQAVDMAERACKVTGFQDPLFIGTLAATYAETGRFADAIKMAEQAKNLAAAQGKAAIAEKNQELLELYRAGKPYHGP